MSKIKSAFFCQHCGYELPKWVGKCPSCGQWNTVVEEALRPGLAQKGRTRYDAGRPLANAPKTLLETDSAQAARIITPDGELNRVLGGGIVLGSLVLIGGEPGIGKSTLMLQMGLSLPQCKTLYVSGEESEPQIKLRAQRLQFEFANVEYFYTLIENDTTAIFSAIDALKPQLVIIDSIQTLQSAALDSPAGSIAQVRQCAAELMQFAKAAGTPVFLVGHITKDGSLAGPKALEHMVDTALYFEGDRHMSYRILRATKNRFGAASEVGIYEMLGSGLRQVSNPSEILISRREVPVSGATVGAALEGSRPLLIEAQSLVSSASYGTPQRTSTGFDQKRLNMLLAVLEKRARFPMGAYDVFVNMAGGIRVEDPAIDLAVCISIISSRADAPVPQDTCFAAEVGLGGELRAVSQVDRRISEAEKLGFKKIYLAAYGQKFAQRERASIQLKPFDRLVDVIADLFSAPAR